MFKRFEACGRFGSGLLAILIGFILVPTAQARPWTTVEGKVVEAELVEIVQDGKAVVLDVKGNRFTVPLDRLSPKDRGYVQGVQETMTKPSDAEVNKEIDEAVSDDEKEDDNNEPSTVRLKARRVWKSRAGVAIEAQFVRLVYDTIVLKEGSRYHRIQYYDLSTNDRQFLFDAYKAMGKENLLAPVRPDLLDAEPMQPEMPIIPEQPQVAGTPAGTSPNDASADSDVKLPSNGFGSGTPAGVNLPPSGFGASDTVKLPPGGFGSVASTTSAEESKVNLPPSGFGSKASSSSDVKLPSNGFGSASTSGSSRPSGLPKVGVPTSTIIDSSDPNGSTSDKPLFDVASVPATSSGFDSLPPSSTSGWSDSPSTSVPTEIASAPKQDLAKSSSGKNDSKKSPPSLSEQAKDFNAQMYKPQSDFAPIQTLEPREFTTSDWNLQMFGVTLLGLGSLMITGGYLWMIALAFLDSPEWGLKSLIPGMALVFGVSEWDKASTALLSMGLGICLTLGGFGLLMGVG